MPLRGNVGAVYLSKAVPSSFDKPPDTMEQVGGVFLWEVDVEQIFSKTFAGIMPETHCLTTGWHCTAEMFWGDERFFTVGKEIAFLRLFLLQNNCIEGYIVLPDSLKGEKGKINENELYLEGIYKPWAGGIS